MPVKWDNDPKGPPIGSGTFLHGSGDPALARAVLWPYRSLPRRGMAGILGFAFAAVLIPVLPLLGSPVVWGLLPFALGAVWLLWVMLEKSYTSGNMREDLALWSDRIEIVRTNPKGPVQRWSANPFWVRLAMKQTGGPVDNYLTLSGSGREVELGAFLSPQERELLYADLDALLHRLSR
jgi:uncharacterized membrane protein